MSNNNEEVRTIWGRCQNPECPFVCSDFIAKSRDADSCLLCDCQRNQHEAVRQIKTPEGTWNTVARRGHHPRPPPPPPPPPPPQQQQQQQKHHHQQQQQQHQHQHPIAGSITRQPYVQQPHQRQTHGMPPPRVDPATAHQMASQLLRHTAGGTTNPMTGGGGRGHAPPLTPSRGYGPSRPTAFPSLFDSKAKGKGGMRGHQNPPKVRTTPKQPFYSSFPYL